MKKLIAMLTTVVMLASTLCQTSIFAAFSDVDETHSYLNAITTLTKLSVIDGYEDGTFRPDGEITRAEFTKLIVFVLGYNDLTYENFQFTDVDTSHWAKNYIQTAYNLGIIAGMDEFTFAPDSPVTYEQALKMVVCTLGYVTFAENAGNYPEGYISQATALSITDKINAQYTAPASRAVIAQLLHNSLDIEMYVNNNYTWEKTDKTLMKDYLKVKKLKGTLVGVEDTVTEQCTHHLTEEEMNIMTTSGEEIIINYSAFTQNTSDISKYLGNTITIYYRQLTDNDEKTLLIIDDETTKNTVIELSYDDIDSLSSNKLKYYETPTKSKTVSLRDTDLTVLYNGKIVSAMDTIILKDPDSKDENSYSREEALELWLNHDTGYTVYGSIILTDNANDNTIDMIQITDYEVMVAHKTPTTSDYRLTDKLVTGNYLILDPQAGDYTYKIKKNDVEIPLTSISANDVVLYAKSLDSSLYSLLVSNKTVVGSITSMNTSNAQMTISNTEYKIGDKCESYIKDKDGRDLKVGASGTFYLDSFGTAVFGTLQATAVIPYAYVTNAFIDYEEGGKAYLTVYAPTVSTSSAESHPIKSRVKFNGSTISDENAIEKLKVSSDYTNGDTEYSDKIYGVGKTPTLTGYSQPVRVTIKNKEITEIITLDSEEIQAQNDNKESIVKCKDIDQYTYSSNSFTLDGKNAFSVNSSTIVLCIPGDRSNTSKYAKKAPSSAFSSGDSYYLEAYDINSSKIAGLIILYGNDGSLTPVKKDTDFSVVATLPESIYSEEKDDTVLKFTSFAGASNALKTWTTFDDTEFADVEVGDVIQFSYDSDKYAQGLIYNMKFADIAEVLDGQTYDDQQFNWTEELEPTDENNNQKYKFDYRFKKVGTSEDELYTSSSLGKTVPYSRATMYNISQVLTDDKKLYVTQNGFYEAEDGTLQLDNDDYEEITIASSTKIVRMEDERDEISKHVANTTTDMTITDLKDAKNYGVDCSKILVCSSKGVAKLIVVYN